MEDDELAVLRALATRVQILEHVLQVSLIIQLQDATDPQALIERLRKYCFAGEGPTPDFGERMEAYLSTIEAIAHLNIGRG